MLVVVPTGISESMDKAVADFRGKFPDATDDDAEHIRQQLLDAFLKYGRIPEFTIEPISTHGSGGQSAV
jgi:hypothetical protein